MNPSSSESEMCSSRQSLVPCEAPLRDVGKTSSVAHQHPQELGWGFFSIVAEDRPKKVAVAVED